MNSLINIDRLNIYRRYGGDIDGLLRYKRRNESETFGTEIGKIWKLIGDKIQDLELIQKGLTTQEYADKSINELKALCDNNSFESLTKDIQTTRAIGLIDIIKAYQALADKAVNIFKEKYNIEDILEGWHSGIYEQTGEMNDVGLTFYAFHGIGLAAHFHKKIIDFDFAYFPEPRHDGFDEWRLSGFIKNQSSIYPDYLNNNRVASEFNKLINLGIISNPNLTNSTTLYFFNYTLAK